VKFFKEKQKGCVANVNELLEKYRALFAENHSLREENEIRNRRSSDSTPQSP